MSREHASPDLANLIAARLSPEEFDRRASAPLTDAEAEEIAELVSWFLRRYPSAKERLAYARRKLRQYRGGGASAPGADYLATARRLARAHREADPGTEIVLLAPDPDGKEIRLLEVTRSAPTIGQPLPVGFAARPDLGIPFPSAILLLSPEEWDAAQAGRLELPDEWGSGRLEAL